MRTKRKKKRRYSTERRQNRSWGERKLYPWSSWFNGERWMVEPGADYTVSQKAFRDHVYISAKRLGLKAKVRHEGGGVFTIRAEKRK